LLSNDGPDLQEKLKSYAQGKTSYIEQFCRSSYSTLPSYFMLTVYDRLRVRLVSQL
jgi:hypothetical protein